MRRWREVVLVVRGAAWFGRLVRRLGCGLGWAGWRLGDADEGGGGFAFGFGRCVVVVGDAVEG